MQSSLSLRCLITSGLATLPVVLIWAAAAHGSAITIGSYYQETSDQRTAINPPTAGVCNANLDCYWMFNVVPTGKQLVVTEISCQILALGTGSGDLSEATIMSQANGAITDRRHFFQPYLMYSVPPINYSYIFRGTTMQLFRAGERPLFKVRTRQADGSSGFRGTCTFSGRIGNPPP